MVAESRETVGKDEFLLGVGTHAHSVIDFDVSFNHTWMLMEWCKKYKIRMIGYKGLLAADARELMLEEAVEAGCDNFLIMDADHIFHLNHLDYLLENKDQAMVSGLVCRRFYPFGQVAWGRIDDENRYVSIDMDLNGSVYEVGVCAFGCTLINIHKLKTLEKPWFRDTCTKDANGKLANQRSDINLCTMFREKGYKVWVDTRVLIGHLGCNVSVYPQNAKALENFRYQYYDMFKLKKGEEGDFTLVPRLL